MIMENMLYITGLTLVIIYIVLGADDFVWDIFHLFRRLTRRKQVNKDLDIKQLDSAPPKLLAIVIAAWHEENVLGDVIDNIIASAQYPKSMYHIFLGIYPNDEATKAVAKELSQKHFNVHVVINSEPGPTSKAQNINHVIRQIKLFEQERNWEFASLTIHDSEDVVHPYEFKMTNYLLDSYEVMQFPVFPLIRKPSFRNFFSNITTGTYADEFAEQHFINMVNRRNIGALVPSAGTGLVLSKNILKRFGDKDVLPKNSLTEDYRLALTLFKQGINVYYVLERVPRLLKDNKLTWDFIATRSLFPNTFKTATRQKSRWVLGITMQSLSIKDVFTKDKIGFVGRYSLYKDLKAKVSNLLNLIGYPVLIYFLVSLFNPFLISIYPKYSLSWYLSLVVVIMMIERQIFRGIAIYNVYGMRSVFFACLYPPLMPMRLFWGNILNMVATFKAYKQNIFKSYQKPPKEKQVKQIKEVVPISSVGKNKQLAWAKTDHSFLEKDILMHYHRKLGDILLKRGYVTPKQLGNSLHSLSGNKLIGNQLLEFKLITEEQLLDSLSEIKLIPYVEGSSLKNYRFDKFAGIFDEKLMRKIFSAPLLSTEKGFVIAFCDKSPMNAQTILREKYNIEINAAFMSEKDIKKVLDIIYGSLNYSPSSSLILRLYEQEGIHYEQAIIANNYKERLGIEGNAILNYMGLLAKADEVSSELLILNEVSN